MLDTQRLISVIEKIGLTYRGVLTRTSGYGLGLCFNTYDYQGWDDERRKRLDKVFADSGRELLDVSISGTTMPSVLSVTVYVSVTTDNDL